jgi:hypothetical protein
MINDISEILNFRYNVKDFWRNETSALFLEYNQILKSPHCIGVYAHFHFLLHGEEIKINKQSKNNDVFCNTFHIHLLGELTNKYPDNFNNLVIMGTDINLSKTLDLLKHIKHRFKKIYYEAKDVECDWVQTLPMGMMMSYMVRNGGNNVILPQVNKKKNKTKLIATAFGSKWSDLTKKIRDRSSLETFTKDSDFVDDMFCEPIEYYENLCDYRFFACPLGNGIQTPKICECIMCETVPVVTNHVAHRELRDIYGLPLLIVNEWFDLTEQFLNDQWNAVYSKIDWHEQKNNFLVKNFNKLLK